MRKLPPRVVAGGHRPTIPHNRVVQVGYKAADVLIVAVRIHAADGERDFCAALNFLEGLFANSIVPNFFDDIR